MKIKGSSSSSASLSKSSAGGKKSSGVGFAKSLRAVGSASSTTASASTSASSPILSINSILATQMVGAVNNEDKKEEGTNKQKLVSHAKDILDDLDEIHKGIVLGLIPKAKLLDITKRLQNRKTSVKDSNLMGLIEEVELRASVELAKYNRNDSNMV